MSTVATTMDNEAESLVPKKARPMTIYEKKYRKDGEFGVYVEFIITDEKGDVIDCGTKSHADYNAFLTEKRFEMNGYKRLRIDLNPLLVKKEFLYDADIKSAMRFKLFAVVGLPVMVVTILASLLYLKADVSAGLEAAFGQISAVVSSVKNVENRVTLVEGQSAAIVEEIAVLKKDVESANLQIQNLKSQRQEPSGASKQVVAAPGRPDYEYNITNAINRK